MAFHHLAVQVHDLPRAERWYRDVLGLAVMQRWPGPDGQERSIWLALDGGAFLALERCDGEPVPGEGWARPAPGYFVLALRIAASEREAWEARLAAHGVASLAPVASNDTEAGKQQNRRVELVRQ